MSPPVRWLLVVLGCVSCASTPTPSPSPDASRPVRVLFVGNSFTYYNDLPAMLEGFTQALAPGRRLETDSVLEGGATLASLWKGDRARPLIREGAWNYVVLQDQSMLGGLRINGESYMNDPEVLFLPYGRLFAQEVKGAGARPVFYMTWSRKDDLPAQEVLTRAYARLAREQQGVLSPVGVAWLRVRRERPELELYFEDGRHPSPAGTYLAACVLFTSLFHQSCLGAPSTFTGAPWTGEAFDPTHPETLVALPEDTARYLQQVGSEVGLAPSLPASGLIEPAAPVRPQLPRGAPFTAEQVSGEWRGTLSLYPVKEGAAHESIELALEARGEQPTGRVRIVRYKGDPIEADITPRIEGEVLSFSFVDPHIFKGTLHWSAVLVEGELRGVASVEDYVDGRWYGAWSARPVQGPPSPALRR